MAFKLIDIDKWHRKEFYLHYIDNVVCSYSATVDLDITPLRGQRLYAAMLWMITDTVNEYEEFRTYLSSKGLGIFDAMHPSYTIFNQRNKNFSVIWTEFSAEYAIFLRRYQHDVSQYSASTALAPKPEKPENTFDVSMIPWMTFTSFNLNIFGDGKYLLPIFTMGKAFIREEKTYLPLSIQVHHAVCDGYHVSRFVDTLQKKIYSFPSNA